MVTSIKINGNEPSRELAVLADLIAKREKLLRGETTKNATIATAINVITSLKGDSKKAPLKAKKGMYTVHLEAANAAGWRTTAAGRRRSPVIGGHWNRGIKPVNLMYGLKGNGDLYRIIITNPKLTPMKSKNAPVYFVLAPNAKVAENYAKERVTHALSKESGMARYALSIAQAKSSDRPMTSAPTGSKQMRLAREAAVVSTSGDDHTFNFSMTDNLNYSVAAQRGGAASLTTAMKKAANRTAGILNKLGGYSLREKIPTPFPEVKGKK